MSIDREINSRVDTFRNKPQELQKRYAVTKQLVDLLALQRIKTQQDDVRRQIEMEMQTNPATIKQQREQEVFGRTAQDVAQQVGGVLQTAKNRQQMAQRRPAPQGLGALMPQQGQRPQQPQTRMMQAGGIVAFDGTSGSRVSGPPKTQEEQIQYLIDQGLTDEQIRAEVKKLGLLPQAADQIIQQVRSKRLATAPAGPMEEVVVTGQRERAQPVQAIDKPSSKEAEPVSPGAQIDVTNYSQLMGPTETRSTKKDDPSVLSKVMEGLGAIGKGFAERTGESIEEASGIRKRMREALTPESVLEAQRTGEYKYNIPDQTQPPQDKAKGIAAVAEPEIPTAENALVLRDQQNVPAGTAPSGTAPSGTAPSKPQGFDLQTALSEVEPLEYTPVDRTGTDTAGIERLKRFGMDPATLKSPEDVGKAAYDTAAQQLGITVSDEDAEKGVLTKDAERRKGLAELAAIDAAQTDPEKLRREQLMSFLLGGAGRGRTALAGGASAAMKRDLAQQKDIRARQVNRNTMVAEIQNANTELIKSAQARGDTATTRQANVINNAMQTLATYEAAEMKARSADATNQMSAQIANYEQKIKQIELLAEQAQNRIQARIDRGDTLRDVQNDARDQQEKISEQLNTLQAEAVAKDPVIGNIDMAIAKASNKDDADEVTRLRKQRVKEVQRVYDQFIIDNRRLYDLYVGLTQTINRLDSQIQSTVMGDSGVNTQQVEGALQRQLRKEAPEYLQPYNP